jgi:hypothetical protein
VEGFRKVGILPQKSRCKYQAKCFAVVEKTITIEKNPNILQSDHGKVEPGGYLWHHLM